MSAFWASWMPCYICWVRHVLTLALFFQIFGWKSRMDTRLLEFGGIRLVINQSVVPLDLESSPKDRSYLFRCLISKVIFFILSTLYIEHCLLILPLFVAICEIWLLGLTYGVYLVLSLKPDATLNDSVVIHFDPYRIIRIITVLDVCTTNGGGENKTINDP